MFLRIKGREYDTSRVPFMILWKTVKRKEEFVKCIVNINQFKRYTKLKGYDFIKTEHGVFKSSVSASIKFEDAEEKRVLLREIFSQGDDFNSIVRGPNDIPAQAIGEWIAKSLKDFGFEDSKIETV